MKKFKILFISLLISFTGYSQLFGLGSKIVSGKGVAFDRPTYISHTKNSILASNSLTLTKPSNIVTGDLLFIIVGNDDASNTDQWSGATKPTGFTFYSERGSTTSACHYGSFWKIADGTEGATIACPATDSADYWGFYLHIKGANDTTPIGNQGIRLVDGSNSSRTLVGVAGNIDDLGIYFLSFDGGDGVPFAVTAGDGWIEEDEVQAGTASDNASGTFGTKIYDSTAAENVTISSNVSDGSTGVQFRIVK